MRSLAARLGLSRQAVGKALSGGRSSSAISEATRARVLAEAERLGYRPHAAARAVTSGRQGAIGLLLGEHLHRSHLPAAALRGIHDRLAAERLHLVVAYADDARLADPASAPRLLAEVAVDGLLLNYTHATPAKAPALIRRHRIPAIWLNCRRREDCVHVDEVGSGRRAAEALLGRGRRRLAFLDWSAGLARAAEAHHSHADRLAGCRTAARTAGAPLVEDAPANGAWGRAARERALVLLSGPERPDGVVAYGGVDVEAILHACTALGLEPGRELGLVTFAPDQTRLGPVLAHLAPPDEELGRRAVEELLALLAGPGQRPPVALAASLAPGASL